MGFVKERNLKGELRLIAAAGGLGPADRRHLSAISGNSLPDSGGDESEGV
jgi:hypothetical protein